jgi:hypothetical protein
MYPNFKFISVCVNIVLFIFMKLRYKCLCTANLFTQFTAQMNFCFKHAADQSLFLSLALQPQFGPWPTSMKLSVSLRFSRS